MRKQFLSMLGVLLAVIGSSFTNRNLVTEYFFPLNGLGSPLPINTVPPTSLSAYDCRGQASYCAAGFTQYVTIVENQYSAVISSWVIGTTAHKY